MTLCIATIVPDGIVFCSDTLQTVAGNQNHSISISCNSCQNPSQLNISTPTPFGSSPTSKKQHYLKVGHGDSQVWYLGLLQAGMLDIVDERVSKLLRDFEQKIIHTKKIEEIAEDLKDFILQKVIQKNSFQSISEFSGNIHFIVAGYDKNESDKPKCCTIFINNNPTVTTGISCSAYWIGRIEIPRLLNNNAVLGQLGLNALNMLFNTMNLQDAIDYNRFLIKTVSDFQRFAPMIPDVGGDIEVSVLRKNRPPKWISKFELK